MKIVALTLARNEDWILGATGRIAMTWADEWVVLNHGSVDRTEAIVREIGLEFPNRVHLECESDADTWEEMNLRHRTLTKGRKIGGTHFAIVDADEFLTANLTDSVRGWIKELEPGELLDLPMVPCWRGFDRYRDDTSVWSSAVVTTAFRDRPDLSWKPDAQGYQHHNRPPHGSQGRRRPLNDKRLGGVVHAQFANWRRLVAKHVLYRMIDHLRWPGRDSVSELNRKYDQALSEHDIRLSFCPTQWTSALDMSRVDLVGIPWHEAEIRRLLSRHSREKFVGLDLKGF